jgi:hypothetical protein
MRLALFPTQQHGTGIYFHAQQAVRLLPQVLAAVELRLTMQLVRREV